MKILLSAKKFRYVPVTYVLIKQIGNKIKKFFDEISELSKWPDVAFISELNFIAGS